MSFKTRSKFVSLLVFVVVVALALAPSAALAATTLKISGSTTVYPLAQSWATAYHRLHPTVSVTVAGGGSSVGFKDADTGRVDIGMSSRDYKSSDPSGLVMTVVARDAVAVAVNPRNSVRKLTAAQVKGIFTGRYTNWRQVGGPNKAIVLVGRTGASGTYEFFKESFLGGSRQSSRTRQYASNGMVRSAVARNTWAIGYISIAYLNSSVRGVTVDGKTPTKANALSGRYPHVRPLYFITKGSPTGEAARFITYCRSSAGQAIAAREYLPYR